MRNWAIAMVLLLALGLSAWGQKGDDAEQCSPQIDPDVSLPHCTAAINSGRLSTSSLVLTYMGRGVNYLRKRDYDRAIQDFDEVIRLNPKSSGAFTNRGASYLQKGDYERAIQDFDKAIQLNPRNKVVFSQRGDLFYREGDYERAIQDFSEYIRLNPGSARAFKNRGRARFYSGQSSAAASDFVHAADADPQYIYAPIWLYLARSRAGRQGEARSELAKYAAGADLTKWPGPVINLYLDRETPESIFNSARDSAPSKDREQHCEAFFYLGQLALQKGERQEANRRFQQAIDTGVTYFEEYLDAQIELDRLATMR